MFTEWRVLRLFIAIKQWFEVSLILNLTKFLTRLWTNDFAYVFHDEDYQS